MNGSLTENKRDKLKRYLVALGDEELRMLTRTIEYGRSLSMDDIPSDEILGLLRPALAELQPQHLPTLSRVLCEPFEDFFITFRPDVKRTGQIPRNFIAPFKDETAKLLDGEGEAAEQAMVAAFVAQDWEDLAARKRALWVQSTKAWKTSLSAGEDADLTKRMGGTDGMDSLNEAIASLAAAPSILQVRKIMPKKPTHDLNSGQTEDLVAVLEQANTISPGAVGIVVWTIFRRLRTGSTILPVFGRADKSQVTWAASFNDARREIEEALLAENDESAQILIRAMKANKVSTDHIFGELERYLDEADNAQEGCSALTKGKAKEQAKARIKSFSTLVEKQVVSSVNPAVSSAVDSLAELLASAGEAEGEVEDIIRKSELAAKAFARSRRVVERIGIRASYEKEKKELVKTLQRTEDKIKSWLDKSNAREEGGVGFENIIYFCRIVEMILGQKHARDTEHRLLSSAGLLKENNPNEEE